MLTRYALGGWDYDVETHRYGEFVTVSELRDQLLDIRDADPAAAKARLNQLLQALDEEPEQCKQS